MLHPNVKSLFAIIIGFAAGSVVNLGLVTIGMEIFPLPAGADVSTMEALRKSMSLLTAEFFIFPLVGHATGTLVGGWVAGRLAGRKTQWHALIIGLLFFCGGVAMILNCGGPLWFVISDLVLSYFPMALLGGRLARRTE